jgi:NADH-quinone oxidoreductase subunit G
MAKMVNLTIDGQALSVPQGTLIVDAAKQVGNDIPVFCYHPKMEPVGMCRMCLVAIGRPTMDRATNQPVLNEDGTPKIGFGPKLETACTTPVSEGMVVVTKSEPVTAARKDVLEFLLTSHPLDCPVCDKGGECPLQNLTLDYGPGQSRYIFDEKHHQDKHVPLGDLIYLDRERCIQCSRCVRFQRDIAGDPVLAFSQRGRNLEIVTCSDPGFDSYFSGNTTDICPVGALTTADFRFGARAWELKSAASICNQCPVGCNITINVRREAKSGGGSAIKRIMPRQNEGVNEIWICDKGRFGYHYTESPERVRQPLVRKNGQLVPVSWDEALELAASKLKAAGEGLVTMVGGRLSNEDLYHLRRLTKAQGGQTVLDSDMVGGDLVARCHPGPGSNLKDMGAGSAILVVACDLEEEAPLWFLRVRQAAARGAALIVVNPRPTKLDLSAAHTVRYTYGTAAQALAGFLPGAEDPSETLKQAAAAFVGAANAVVIYGSEGLDLAESRAVSTACADLLKTVHPGLQLNNGLLAAWSQGNTQGAWDMGFQPVEDPREVLANAKVAYIAASDPAGTDPGLAKALELAGFVIVQDLLMSPTAQQADIVLPAQAFTEREGTYTSGERIVQRFFPAITLPNSADGPLADFAITARLARMLGVDLEPRAAALVFLAIAGAGDHGIPGYEGISYQKLAEVAEQLPVVGRKDLYYGGTTYENRQGLGIRLSPLASPVDDAPFRSAPAAATSDANLKAYPITRLYDRGSLLAASKLLGLRLAKPEIWMHPETAEQFGLTAADLAGLDVDGTVMEAGVRLDSSLPSGVALVPRSVGIPMRSEYPVSIVPREPGTV